MAKTTCQEEFEKTYKLVVEEAVWGVDKEHQGAFCAYMDRYTFILTKLVCTSNPRKSSFILEVLEDSKKVAMFDYSNGQIEGEMLSELWDREITRHTKKKEQKENARRERWIKFLESKADQRLKEKEGSKK